MTTRCAKLMTLLMLVAPCALAGPYTDDLSKCLVSSTSQTDRVALARWIFIAFSAHPGVAPISAAKPDDIESANVEVAGLLTRLLTDACRDKTQVAIKYEGPAALQQSFQVLGQVAGMELAANPQVQERMSGFVKHIDADKLKALTSEPAVVAK